MVITTQSSVTNTAARHHFGPLEMFNSIAQYDVAAAHRYHLLVNNDNYIERKDNESKATYSKLSGQQRQRILYRLRHPYLFEGRCLVCLDDTNDTKYCCGRCKKVAITIGKKRRFFV